MKYQAWRRPGRGVEGWQSLCGPVSLANAIAFAEHAAKVVSLTNEWIRIMQRCGDERWTIVSDFTYVIVEVDDADPARAFVASLDELGPAIVPEATRAIP